MRRALALLAAGALVASPACAARNYTDPAGPRYAGAYGVPTPPPEDEFKVVSFNIKYAKRITRAINLLREHPDVAGADVLALQEMKEEAVVRIAYVLKMNYVYYPATVHPSADGDFGNALMARWPLVDDRKIILPHHGRLSGRQRTATAATMLLGRDRVRLYSVHMDTVMSISGGQRRDQARAIFEDAQHFALALVAGDFNSRWIGEVFEEGGFAWPTKEVGRTLPLFQWDHVFVKGLRPPAPPAVGVVRDTRGASDHRPVWAVLRLPAPEDRVDRGAPGVLPFLPNTLPSRAERGPAVSGPSGG
jgi:endonuclease/exonuclease/phosphatase family metal-dependent hydrolase